jgi:hypothetical protein
MPVLCRWGSISITIRSREDDRHEPHFHVKCAERSASIGIGGEIYASTLTGRELREVTEWAVKRRGELKVAWDEIQDGRAPGQIEA